MATSMARRFVAAACVAAVAFALLAAPSSGQLDPRFYDKACPAALPTIRRVVEEAVAAEPRSCASTSTTASSTCAPRFAARLHFQFPIPWMRLGSLPGVFCAPVF